ncbi:MAG: AEC family transporter [Clostridia bacterium]|nr:AEC family transporter [Clostridia bacterium]
MSNFLIVAEQVSVLFILIVVGFVLGKKNVMNEAGARVCADIALLVATPCAVVNSFRRESTVEVWVSVAVMLGAALLCHLVGILLAQVVFRGDASKSRVLRVATVMSNAGFMAFPLQLAILGETGLFYGTVYVAMHNMVFWSYGKVTMDTAGGKMNLRKMLINLGTVSLAIGAVVMLLPFDLPTTLAGPLEHLASLCTPIPMLFIGYSLSKVKLLPILKRPQNYVLCALRLLVVPLVSAGVLYLLGVRGTLLLAATIATAAPTATSVSMFATRYGQDEEVAVNVVSLSTVLSLITLPVVVTIVKLFA